MFDHFALEFEQSSNSKLVYLLTDWAEHIHWNRTRRALWMWTRSHFGYPFGGRDGAVQCRYDLHWGMRPHWVCDEVYGAKWDSIILYRKRRILRLEESQRSSPKRGNKILWCHSTAWRCCLRGTNLKFVAMSSISGVAMFALMKSRFFRGNVDCDFVAMACSVETDLTLKWLHWRFHWRLRRWERMCFFVTTHLKSKKTQKGEEIREKQIRALLGDGGLVQNEGNLAVIVCCDLNTFAHRDHKGSAA